VKPERIQLSRKKGWRMPPNTVKVDRTTKWGNPAIVGEDGIAAECVYFYTVMLSGYIVCRMGIGDRQQAALKVLRAEREKGWPSLLGKNLACWCAPDKPCHADILLHVVNRKSTKEQFDLTGYLAKHGYRMDMGKAVKL
jgi:hypothetical protein